MNRPCIDKRLLDVERNVRPVPKDDPLQKACLLWRMEAIEDSVDLLLCRANERYQREFVRCRDPFYPACVVHDNYPLHAIQYQKPAIIKFARISWTRESLQIAVNLDVVPHCQAFEMIGMGGFPHDDKDSPLHTEGRILSRDRRCSHEQFGARFLRDRLRFDKSSKADRLLEPLWHEDLRSQLMSLRSSQMESGQYDYHMKAYCDRDGVR